MLTPAMILAGNAGSRLGARTQRRTQPVNPCAGKYRIVGLPLSDHANSGMVSIGIAHE